MLVDSPREVGTKMSKFSSKGGHKTKKNEQPVLNHDQDLEVKSHSSSRVH